MAEAYTYEELLKKVESLYGLRAEDFAPMTGIPAEMIEKEPICFPGPTEKDMDIAGKRQRETHHIATVLTFFLHPFPCTEDELLRDHLKTFTNRFRIPKHAIAKFTGVSVEMIDGFLAGEEIPAQEKYTLAVRFLCMEWLITKNPYIDV